jgi:hypothetical protein
MLIKLTHPEPNYVLVIDTDEIVMMERYIKPKSVIITANGNDPDKTAIVLKNGRAFACTETPDEILDIIKQKLWDDSII